MLGEMRLIAGFFAIGLPSEQWKVLDGAFYAIAGANNLYSLITTTWGGDGQETFAVPDLRARVDAGASGSFPFSSFAGAQTLNISVAQLAAHAHSLLQLRISAIQHFSDGRAQLTLVGTVGNTCQVDKSDDLATWSNLGAVQFNNSTETITDSNPTHAVRRFYKAYIP